MGHLAINRTFPSTSIEHSLFCNLKPESDELYLVAANDSIISIYKVCCGPSPQLDEKPDSPALLHIKAFQLEGTITGLNKLDSMAFSDSKTSNDGQAANSFANESDDEIYGSSAKKVSDGTVSRSSHPLHYIIISFTNNKVLTAHICTHICTRNICQYLRGPCP